MDLRFAFTWVGHLLGLLLRTSGVGDAVQILCWPIGFLSAPRLPRHDAPAGWARSPPGTALATATAARTLSRRPGLDRPTWPAEHAVLLAVLWPAVLTALFLPLAARQYHRLAR
ncbi:hypothetical protein GCM10020218_066970 [Dactylosporangium vinaceum]